MAMRGEGLVHHIALPVLSAHAASHSCGASRLCHLLPLRLGCHQMRWPTQGQSPSRGTPSPGWNRQVWACQKWASQDWWSEEKGWGE